MNMNFLFSNSFFLCFFFSSFYLGIARQVRGANGGSLSVIPFFFSVSDFELMFTKLHF